MISDIIGIVILNYNTYQDVISCVDSIINTYKKDKKIIVVDNCSTNNSYEILCAHFNKSRYYEEVICVKSEYNGGFAYGNNYGIEVLRKYNIDYAVLTNSDVIFKENSIEILFSGIKNRDNTVIYAPLILDVQGNPLTLPWKKSQSLVQYLGLKSAGNLIYKFDELKKKNPTEVYMVSGCCYAINIEKFKKMGAFDENTFLYHEEGTVGKAALKEGYKTFIDIDATIIHNHGNSTGKSNIFVDTELIMSGLYYWRVYENANIFKLFLIWFFFILKIFIKILLGKYDRRKGFFKTILITGKRLINISNIMITVDINKK